MTDERFDVVIIGGGIIGCSIAYHLALRGQTSVAVLEMGEIGSGATGQSAAMVMQQTGVPLLTTMSLESMDAYNGYVSAGTDVRMETTGSLLYSTTPEGERKLVETAQLQNELGIATEVLYGSQLARFAHLNVEDIRVGSFCSRDGFVDAFGVLRFYLTESQRRGVTFLTNRKVVQLNVAGDRIVSVQTTEGLMRAGTVVNAAGSFARVIANWVGVSLPVDCNKRHLVIARPLNPIAAFPISEDIDDEWYFRAAGTNVLVGVGQVDQISLPDNCDVLDVPRDRDALTIVARYVEHRMPPLARCLFPNYWAGVRAVTADGMPLIGRATIPANLIYCCGMSGFGITNAPAWGRLVAAFVENDSAAERELRPFSADRFAYAAQL